MRSEISASSASDFALEIVAGLAHRLVRVDRRHDSGQAAGGTDLVEQIVVGLERVGERALLSHRGEIVQELLCARKPRVNGLLQGRDVGDAGGERRVGGFAALSRRLLRCDDSNGEADRSERTRERHVRYAEHSPSITSGANAWVSPRSTKS